MYSKHKGKYPQIQKAKTPKTTKTNRDKFKLLMEELFVQCCCKDRWTKRGGELGLFQFLKQSIATLTYAMLVGHQFTNRITKLLTQAKRDKTK